MVIVILSLYPLTSCLIWFMERILFLLRVRIVLKSLLSFFGVWILTGVVGHYNQTLGKSGLIQKQIMKPMHLWHNIRTQKRITWSGSCQVKRRNHEDWQIWQHKRNPKDLRHNMVCVCKTSLFQKSSTEVKGIPSLDCGVIQMGVGTAERKTSQISHILISVQTAPFKRITCKQGLEL